MRPPLGRDDIRAGYSDVLSVRIDELGPDRCVVSCPIEDSHLQALGIVHGGVYCWLVETAASAGAAYWFADRGSVVGVSNHTNFLQSCRSGHLTATAIPLQRGRTRQIWQVTITDDSSRGVAVGELHLANLSPPASHRGD